jgi:hypothetical protein
MIGGTLDVPLVWMRCFGGVCTSFWLSEIGSQELFRNITPRNELSSRQLQRRNNNRHTLLTPVFKVSCILNRSMADCRRVVAGCCPLFFLSSSLIVFCFVIVHSFPSDPWSFFFGQVSIHIPFSPWSLALESSENPRYSIYQNLQPLPE